MSMTPIAFPLSVAGNYPGLGRMPSLDLTPQRMGLYAQALSDGGGQLPQTIQNAYAFSNVLNPLMPKRPQPLVSEATLPKADSVGTGISLMDPATQYKTGVRTRISEYIVSLNAFQKAALSFQNLVIETPKSVWKGLSGDPRFEFSDKMRVAQIPYYLGGAALVASYLAPGGSMAAKNALKPALACLGYFIGFPVANAVVNTLYKLRYGVDLTMKYHNNKGQIAGVFDSVMFDRDDLLSKADLQTMRRKMNIPETIAAPDWEVRRQLDGIVPAARVSKILLGNVLAAVGAGYLAHLGGTLFQSPRTFLQDTLESAKMPASWPEKLRNVGVILKRYWQPPVGALKAPRWPANVALVTVMASLLYTLFAMENAHIGKHYEPAGGAR
ncbi:MAG: hypothetical protein VKK59_00125 [Vampirovibrionales bacterium]|nr:hypothetical protein [Vampirovibrionales bacterium]